MSRFVSVDICEELCILKRTGEGSSINKGRDSDENACDGVGDHRSDLHDHLLDHGNRGCRVDCDGKRLAGFGVDVVRVVYRIGGSEALLQRVIGGQEEGGVSEESVST